MSDRNILAELKATVYHQCYNMTVTVSLKDRRTDEAYVFAYPDHDIMSSSHAIGKALAELNNLWSPQ